MPSKRGRPLSQTTDDPTLNRRRVLAAARVQRFRHRQRDERTSITRPTSAQLQQGEQIISLAMTDEEEAAVTLSQMGLRVSGLTIARDAQDAQLQQGATEVDEHRTLYKPHTLITASNNKPSFSYSSTIASTDQSSPRPSQLLSSQSQLSRFFPQYPPRNPFIASTVNTTPPLIRLSPVRPSFSPLSSSRRSPFRPSFSPLSSSIRESIGAQHRGSEDLIFADNDNNDDNDDNDDDDFRDDESIFRPQYIPRERGGSFDNGSNGPGTARRVHNEEDDFAGQHTNSGEEDSVYDFASERSAPHSDNEDDEQPPSDLQHTVNKLIAFFQGDVGGCTCRQHMAYVADDDHYGLNDIFNDRNSISVLASSDLLSPDQLSCNVLPRPVQLQSAFCGISPQHLQPQHVCFHREETRKQPLRHAFDIDSYLGFLHSLAPRKGLWHQPVPQARQNMTNDVYLETPLFVASGDGEHAPRATLAMLRDVPHFLLGRAANAHDITIHILSPHLPQPQDKFISL
ncbi:hypothetical protein PV08_09005 [Exophiala spinifera]|uniref:Uncharacterized protein n=1 Tax=Exophiala spinifera TaxID=91928 RepID=A0A0D2AYD9_9EURO|nr:uncharacterized protein PV08_09005 [Exophiala spinifera]KIW11733.1 hypothetical protein PV08_09005 [Exophiala spinifera]